MDIFTDQGRLELARYAVQSCRIGKYGPGSDERVSITYVDSDPDCVDLAQKVAIECLRSGSRIAIHPTNSRFERNYLEAIPEELLKTMDPVAVVASAKTTCKMFIGMEEDPNTLEGLGEKAALGSENSRRLRKEYDKRSGRFLYLGFPIPHAAHMYGLTPEKLKQVFASALAGSMSPVTKALCKYYHIKFSGGSRIRIFDDNGTDLTMERGDRRALVDDGYVSDDDIAIGDVGSNLPSGETFLSPKEESVNGSIVFPRKNVIPGFGEVEGLLWVFERGKIVGYDAKRGRDNFKDFLDANSGDKDMFAELGIGCNIGAEYTGGLIIIDEKEAEIDDVKNLKPTNIRQTIHCACGGNTGAYGGKNEASNHWDAIRPMKGATITVDGKIIMFNGSPTDEKLFYQCLEEAAA